MFIAMRLSLLISAKSEMLSISLFADEVRGGEVSINIACLRARPVPIRSSDYFCGKAARILSPPALALS
jgi:hypothetical protein